MSIRIATTTEKSAPEATKPILAKMKQALGMVPNVYATIGHSPGSLQSVLAWGEAIGTGGLSKREVEMLNLHLSELNGCAYCVSAHTFVGERVGLKPEEIAAARAGTATSARESAILAFARRVLRTGGSRAGTELARLREDGVSDAEVVDIIAVVALNTFRNAVNIVAGTEIDFPKAAHLPSD